MYNDCQCHADLPCLLSYGSTMGERNPLLLIDYFEILSTSILESQ